jgi:hypothetical protein
MDREEGMSDETIVFMCVILICGGLAGIAINSVDLIVNRKRKPRPDAGKGE